MRYEPQVQHAWGHRGRESRGMGSHVLCGVFDMSRVGVCGGERPPLRCERRRLVAWVATACAACACDLRHTARHDLRSGEAGRRPERHTEMNADSAIRWLAERAKPMEAELAELVAINSFTD